MESYMRMLSPRQEEWTTVVRMLIGGLCLCAATGCSERDSSEQFVAELRDNPIIRTDGVSIFALGPRAAILKARDAQNCGFNLLALYRAYLNDARVRNSLAYMMLLSENQGYLQELRRVKRVEVTDDELAIARFVLEDDVVVMSEVYRMKLEEVVSGQSKDTGSP